MADKAKTEASSEPKKKKTIQMEMIDPTGFKPGSGGESLMKSLLNVLDGGDDSSIERLAFEEDPAQHNQYSGLYKSKLSLIPDTILKRISIQDDLVAAIANTRANHLSSHGRPRRDRFSMGYVIEPKPGVLDRCNPEQKKDLQLRIAKATAKLGTCGSTDGWGTNDRMTFSQYLQMSTRDAVTVGRIATEIIHVDAKDGKSVPHSFRPIDAGTIYRAAPYKDAAQSVRDQALGLLQQIKNKKLIPERYVDDEYAWIQVIQAKPEQAFTAKECVVHNFYPVTHIELGGYPLTPIDTIIAAVTTHINITNHNKLYFQHGRASRGMLIVKSDDMKEGVIARIKQQFNASINSVQNAWRMPVFGIGMEDDISWQPIDQGQRDAEFQYLSDSNARVILSAYQMSPEELPGYAHLSRGTNSQALSESNNEYKLQAARDVGIKPLIKQWEDFLNANILPILDSTLAELVEIRLLGLDAETAEKESVRLQQDMPVHMTYDEVLEKVEKKPVGETWGGSFPINPQYQAILDSHSGLTAGEIAAHFMNRPELKDRPDLQYVRDPMWFQFVQMQQQMQQAQQAAQQPQPPPQGGGQGGGQQDQGGQDQGQQGQGQPQQGQPQQGQDQQGQGQDQQGQDTDLTRSIDQAIGLLTKSEKQLPLSKRKLLAQHRATVDHFMKGWEEDVAEATAKILKAAEVKLPRKKR